MIKLNIYKPKDYVVGRTQSYRVKIVAELDDPDEGTSSSSSSSEEEPVLGLCDALIFKVQEDAHGFTHFLGVCQPYDLGVLQPTGSPRRTDVIDCYLPGEVLADPFIEAVTADVQALLNSFYGFQGNISLSGGTV